MERNTEMPNPFADAFDAVKNMLTAKPKDEDLEEYESHIKPGAVVRVEDPKSVDAVLNQRGQRYGSFHMNSVVYVHLMEVFEQSPNWTEAPPSVKHACGNIATKLARLLTGEVMYDDNWQDIAGYATLMAKICRGEAK